MTGFVFLIGKTLINTGILQEVKGDLKIYFKLVK